MEVKCEILPCVTFMTELILILFLNSGVFFSNASFLLHLYLKLVSGISAHFPPNKSTYKYILHSVANFTSLAFIIDLGF